MKKSILCFSVTTVGFLFSNPAAHAVNFGPTAYLTAPGAADSLYGGGFSFSSYYLQNFESLPAGQTNNTNINLSSGGTTVTFSSSTLQFGAITDSVDADDGVINGSGLAGRSLFSSGGSTGITFNFTGTLPTHAGIVWTDGAGTISFEAFNQSGVSLGIFAGNHADGSVNGETAEDRFYGASNAGGISSFRIWNSSGGIEVDHFQYGIASNTGARVPDSVSTLGALAGCVLGLYAFRRRQT